MKVSLFIMFVCVFQLFAVNTEAQNAVIELKSNNLSIEELFQEIENQTDYLIIYSTEGIRQNFDVSLSKKKAKISDFLDESLNGQGLKYEFVNNYIILSKLETPSPQQNRRKLTGTVYDENQVPVIGANIIEKGNPTNGTVTDIDGKFSLDVPNNAVLQVTYIGYLSQEIAVKGQTSMPVVLMEDTRSLDEVVVIGYGTTTRQNFTGSVATVKVEDSPAALTPTTNVMNLLRGTVAGITVNRSGESGASPAMQVRGQRSINGNSDPLFVLDGVIFNGTLNDLDVNSIESISVLKDASTLAAYGTRAANGVVMITSQKGKRGKPVINLNTSWAMTAPNFRPDMRDGEGYNELLNRRSGLAPDADPIWMSDLEKANYEKGETTDWFDYIIRPGLVQNYSLSFSGATENMNYYMSAGRWDQKGNYYGDNFQRNTFSARMNTNINQYVEIGANVNLAYNNSDGVRPSYGGSISTTPWGEPELANGNIRKFPDGRETSVVNPLWNTFNGVDRELVGSTQVLGGFVNIKIPGIEGLTYKITGSYTNRSSETRQFTHETNWPEMSLGDAGYTTEIFDSHLVEANGSITNNGTKSWILDNILNYTRSFDKHYFNATLVYTRDEQVRDNTRMTGSDFRGIGNTSLGFYGLTNADVQKIELEDANPLTNSRIANIGYLGRLNYSFDNKYHVNLAVRRDGASVFGQDKKWGTFPSVGVAWTVTRESFMQHIESVDDLKLKLSWGKNGNQALSPYRTLSPVAMGRGGNQVYYFGGNVAYGQQITALGNPTLGWEETTSLNYGFEMDILKERLHMDVNIYNSVTREQIFNRVVPPMNSGISRQDATMGQVNNRGVEISLNATPVKRSDFTWNAGLIFTLNRNKLVDLYGDGQDDIANSLFLGKSLGAIYGYAWDGIVQEGEDNYLTNLVPLPGDPRYVDLNGDGRLLDADDRKILGYDKENFRLSMTNTFSYKNFDLYIMINGTFGGNGYGMARNNNAYLTGAHMFYFNSLDFPYWTPENRSEKYPKWTYQHNRFIALQSYSFVRLQDVNLSYTFPERITNKLGVNGLKLFLSGTNLLFYAPHWEGSDPEIRNYGAAQLQRVFTFGINVKF
ncbi:MAG: TonB-dependent receptor [Tannerellaceae bacterium]|nr:TonB-dependent receptor [Tannerellaceae bacterium]